MKVNNYPVKTPAAGDKLFGSDSNGDQKQFDMTSVSSNVFQYEIGEYVEDEGGVIFHRYLDGNTQNYLVVSITDQSTGQAWSNIDSTLIGSTAQSLWNGLPNSNAIVAQPGETSSAAALCLNYAVGAINDWYLPSIQELNKLWNNYLEVSKTLSQTTGATQLQPDVYWSSTETDSLSAWAFDFRNGTAFSDSKVTTYYVRAVRKFNI